MGCKCGSKMESPPGSNSESPIESGIPHTKLNDDDVFEVPHRSEVPHQSKVPHQSDTSPTELKDDGGYKGIPPIAELKDDDGYEEIPPIAELKDDDGYEVIPPIAGETPGSDKERLIKKAVLVHSTDCDWCAVFLIISFIFWSAVLALCIVLIGDYLNSTPAPTSLPSIAPSAGCNTTCLEICDSSCTMIVIEEEYFYSDFCRAMCAYHGDSEDECEYICYARLVLDCKEKCEKVCNC